MYAFVAFMTLSSETRLLIEHILTSHPTVLFMKGTQQQPRCGYSAAVVDILRRMGVSFYDVDVLANPTLREGIKVYGNWPTIPQLYHRGELIGGCDVVRELVQRGELAKVLEATGTALPSPHVQNLTVQELKTWMKNKTDFRLYDVRTEAERRLAHIPGSVLLDPQTQFTLDLLPKETKLVFVCHHGGRSRAAAERALQKGFTQVWNVQGGIDAWSQHVDPSVPRY